VSSGVAARSRRKAGGRVAILAYHNVVPSGAGPPGDASLHLEVDRFRRQLDRLVETHRVVSLAEAVGDGWADAAREAGATRNIAGREGGETKAIAGRSDAGMGRPVASRPAAAITFDDGYRGVLRHAVPELVARGLPATVFVCPGLLGAEGFWWDRVSLSPGGAPAGWRESALEALAGRQDAVMGAMPGGEPPHVCRPVTEEELHELAEAPGITLASHTWSHPNLTALPDDDLAEELARPARWLAEHVPDSHLVGHVTFPYGLWDQRVRAAGEAAGYRFQYRVEGGLAVPGGTGGPRSASGGAVPGSPGAFPAIVLPRINVPAGVSVRGFELRTSGVLA
jgi:peptidoglycan/xylan/chitin deacetylase (PgdA/CDA1 family)